jgi:hypothetical protein
VKRVDELDAAIAEWTRKHSREEVLRVLDDADVPAGSIYTVADIVSDPQYLAREMVIDSPTSDGKPLKVPGSSRSCRRRRADSSCGAEARRAQRRLKQGAAGRSGLRERLAGGAHRRRLRMFAAERDWDQFHTPKNLAIAMMVEAAEVAEHFQWSAPDEAIGAEKRDADRDGDRRCDAVPGALCRPIEHRSGRPRRTPRCASTPSAIRWTGARDCPQVHRTVIVRRGIRLHHRFAQREGRHDERSRANRSTASFPREAAATMSGREVLQAIIDGRIPRATMSRTLTFDLVEVGDGFCAFEGDPGEHLLNPMGTVHGGWALTLIDSVTGCAGYSDAPGRCRLHDSRDESQLFAPDPGHDRTCARGRPRRVEGTADHLD